MRQKPPNRTVAASAPSRRGGQENRVRIIGGRWRGRKLAFPDAEGLRPTGDRIRETLFNWLMPVLPGARCLDLFAGSGALGFEALSRGAASCVFVERHPAALRQLEQSRTLLGATPGAVIVSADSAGWIDSANGCFDIVFIDPPFAAPGMDPAVLVHRLASRELLSPAAMVYVEQPHSVAAALPEGFHLHRQQRAGQVSASLWQRQQNPL